MALQVSVRRGAVFLQDVFSGPGSVLEARQSTTAAGGGGNRRSRPSFGCHESSPDELQAPDHQGAAP